MESHNSQNTVVRTDFDGLCVALTWQVFYKCTYSPNVFDLKDKELEQHVFPAQADGSSDET